MFEKYPDQARERRYAVWAGVGFIIVGFLFFYWGGSPAGGLIFFLPGLVLSIAAIFCSHSSFKRVMKIASFFEGFT